MKKKLFFATLIVAVPLAIGIAFMLHPTRARGEDNQGQAMEIRVDNFTFSPETLTVPVNSAVTWVNKDDIPHVIASTDGLFKSKALDTEQQYSFTFTKAGTYPYFCAIHPKMVGKIVVH
ncbi:MAG TPA: cupredoxin family copper-binding protein [Terriglobales bacterium]|nr:cupredoxin family copper-binding protein [Terriglobales bacterium]